MPLSPGYSDYVQELIAGFGKVEVKRMFGGAALYRNGVGFGILDDDVFFIKADKAFGAELKAPGLQAVVLFDRQGRFRSRYRVLELAGHGGR